MEASGVHEPETGVAGESGVHGARGDDEREADVAVAARGPAPYPQRVRDHGSVQHPNRGGARAGRLQLRAAAPGERDPSNRRGTALASELRRLRAIDGSAVPPTDEELLLEVARGDQQAFAELYDRVAGTVYGVVRRVLRDPAQSEEVTQEVLVEVWRTATSFDTDRGRARTWILTMAHRRAVDRVRSEQASRERTDRVGHRNQAPAFDEVAELVETRFEHEQVREGLAALTALQREAVELAYFQGYTYREVSELLETPLGTIKTRMRDGLIRLRDAMGVTT